MKQSTYKKADAYMTRAFEIWLMVAEDGMTEADAKRQAIWNELMHAVGKRKCTQHGHKLKDTSHGGPESGSMGARCTRCGWSFNVNMY